MNEFIWLYALLLGVFLLGIIASTLWEWLFFRQKRLHIENSRINELEETVRSLTRATAPDAMPRVDAWPPPDYESPGVFLESEESNIRTRAAQPQGLYVVPSAPVRTTVSPIDASRSSSANNPAVDTQQTPGRVSPLTSAAMATLATAGAIHAAANQPDSAIEPASSSDGAAVVEESLGTTGEIAGYDALALSADQPDAANLAGAAPQLVAADESTILPAKIDTLVAKIEHLIDTMGTTQPTEGVSPAATAGASTPLLLRANALPLAESPTLEGDNETSSELDDTYSAKNLSRGEYAVVQVMQAARKTLRDLQALFGKRLATRPLASGDVSSGVPNSTSNLTAPDDLTRIPSLSVAHAERLQLAGITTYHRLAGVTKDELSQLFASPTGEPVPDYDVWLVSARLLAAQVDQAAT